ncbi:MAG TPA: hypothetical protein VHY37_02005 [Tepidisphaeraceae bacterium]|nr:hypothetical protein [Tepidisphaeraceae bacterium]
MSVVFHRYTSGQGIRPASVAWYAKAEITFVDAQTACVACAGQRFFNSRQNMRVCARLWRQQFERQDRLES